MPNEWDAYLLRMGRKAEIGAGATSEFNLDELCWTEVGGASETHDDEGVTESNRQQPAMTQRRGASGYVRAKTEAHGCSDGKMAPMGLAQTGHAREHIARSFPERARQFMPFAALKGYEEMLAEVEREIMAAQAGPKKFIPAAKIPQPQKPQKAAGKETNSESNS